MAHYGVERPARLDELEQSVALPFEQTLLQRAKRERIQALTALTGRLNEDVQIGQGNAGGQLSELRRIEVGEFRDRPICRRCLNERFARRFVWQRYFNGRDVWISGQ